MVLTILTINKNKQVHILLYILIIINIHKLKNNLQFILFNFIHYLKTVETLKYYNI